MQPLFATEFAWLEVTAAVVTIIAAFTPIFIWAIRRIRRIAKEIRHSREEEARCRNELALMTAKYLTLDFNFRRLWEIVKRSWPAHIRVDQKGNILNWCKQAERLFGYSEAEIVGRTVSFLVPPEAAVAHRKAFVNAVSGKLTGVRTIGPVEAINKHNERFRVFIELRMVCDDNEWMAHAIIRQEAMDWDSPLIKLSDSTELPPMIKPPSDEDHPSTPVPATALHDTDEYKKHPG